MTTLAEFNVGTPFGRDASLEEIYWWWRYQVRCMEAARWERRWGRTRIIDGWLILEGQAVPIPDDPYA